MKVEHPIRVDRQRQRRPGGGQWETLDPVALGRVQVLDVPDAARQAAAVVAEMRRIRARAEGMPWTDFAVLGRTRAALEAIRAVCEDEGVPVAWRENLPPLPRIREVAEFLDRLQQHRGQSRTAAQLRELVMGEGVWSGTVSGVIDAWEDEAGGSPVPVVHAIDFAYDHLLDMRREHSLGDGVFFGTLHGAKGMEFRHVVIADGGWRGDVSEAERRLFFVGMTRAKETLTLMAVADAANPHLELLRGDWLMRREVLVDAPDPAVTSRRFAVLGMSELDLSYAGSFPEAHAIHTRLRALDVGARVMLRGENGRVTICDASGGAVARLSRTAAERWAPNLDSLIEARVVAMVRRLKGDGDPAYQARCRTDNWELPICEVVYLEA